MEPKTERFYIRMSRTEKQRLMRRAEHYHMTASDLARTLLLQSDDGFIRIVDITPFKNALYELSKQGTNLNQLMQFLNTHGAGSYDSYKTRQTLRKEAETFEQIANALIALRKEMAKHGVVLSDGVDDAKP